MIFETMKRISDGLISTIVIDTMPDKERHGALWELERFIVEDRNIITSVLTRDIRMVDVGHHANHSIRVGVYTITGCNPNKDIKHDTYQVLERRIMIPDIEENGNHVIVYMYIIIEILGSESLKNHFKGNDIVSVEKTIQLMNGISRAMDYYLDNVCLNTLSMANLDIRNSIISSDPLIILEKCYLLYMNKLLKDIFIPVDIKDQESYANKYHFVDATLFRVLGNDWILSRELTLSDKAMVFSPQLQLKQEIFQWLSSMDHPMDDEEFSRFFYKNGIYSFMRENGYKTIIEYLNIGANPFSTETLNKEWMKCI